VEIATDIRRYRSLSGELRPHADMREFVCERCPRCDLQQNLWQIRARQSSLHFFAQCDQAIGFIEFVETSQDQIIFAVNLFDSCGAVVRKIRRDRSIRFVEFLAQSGQRFVG
jgi:hypothetical protein